jgi:hypothetical protein
LSSKDIQPELEAIALSITHLANEYQGKTLALLSLLRALEKVHRHIQEGIFQESLPDNRQALYALLKDIEESGGWPYIDRMRLKTLLVNFDDQI